MAGKYSHTSRKFHWALRAIFIFACGTVFLSNVITYFSWSERRGVYDDICYLRQAHLFQRFGLSGIDTSMARDDDNFFRNAERDIGIEHADDPNQAACHTTVKLGKRVIQYPPGTGFVMSLFASGRQTAWLFTTSLVVIFASVTVLVMIAPTGASVVAVGLFGLVSLYLMVNPAKASYSMAPTAAVCAMAGISTSLLFASSKAIQARFLLSGSTGFLLGLAVSFRTSNLLLVVGYLAVLGADLLKKRSLAILGTCLTFAIGYVTALIPSLAANLVNAGGVFTTTYGSQDVVLPDLTFSIAHRYAADLQGLLILWVVLIISWTFRKSEYLGILFIAAIGLIVNLAFFLSHPIFTTYYLMPIILLDLWMLVSLWVLEQRKASDRVRFT